ncbi:MAG: hypothetical protein F4X47_02510 [Gammaproteobacteria bacterium]|nr:hypothetical protein [Gammaproteobacteria bacterium]MYC51170.1 hypothetical protein [Gammaproteobacteria bacterium]
MSGRMTQGSRGDVTRRTFSDWAAIGLRFVPWIGPLAELIPRQREDRLARFVEGLDRRLREIDEEHPRLIEEAVQNEHFVDLLLESFRQATRSLSDDRRQYLSALVVNGLTEQEVERHESRHILRILSELGDVEIVWLRYYLVGTNEYHKRHRNVLSLPVVSMASPQNEQDNAARKRALRDSYLEHLCQLGLLAPVYEMAPRKPLHQQRTASDRTPLPIYDEWTGGRAKTRHEITTLGRLLLEQIGAAHIESSTGAMKDHDSAR